MVTVSYKFEPDDLAVSEIPEFFRLVKITDETPVDKAGRWQHSKSTRKREVLGTAITPLQMARMIADGADWLSYRGD